MALKTERELAGLDVRKQADDHAKENGRQRTLKR